MDTSTKPPNTNLLIVWSGQRLDDSGLMALACQLLDCEASPLERAAAVLHTSDAVVTSAAVAAAALAGTVLPTALTSKSARLARAMSCMDLLTAMLRRLQDSDVSSLLPDALVLRSDAPELAKLKCLGGTGFTEGIAYAAHPLRPGCYLPVGRFHDYLLNEKRAEFLGLMGSLGAAELVLEERQEAEHAAEASAEVDVGLGGGKLKIDRRSARDFILRAEFSPVAPPVPEPTDMVWCSQEPMWMATARARRSYGLKTQSVSFTYENTFGVDLALALRVERSGVRVGGSFREATQIRHAYRVVFHDRATQAA